MIFQASSALMGVAAAPGPTAGAPPSLVDHTSLAAHASPQVYHYPTHHNNNNMMLEAYHNSTSSSQASSNESQGSTGTTQQESDLLQKVVRH